MQIIDQQLGEHPADHLHAAIHGHAAIAAAIKEHAAKRQAELEAIVAEVIASDRDRAAGDQ